MYPPAVQKVIDALREKGYTDDRIAGVTTEFVKAAFTRFYGDAMAAFSEEDVKAVEDCATDEEASAKIAELYQARTGKNAQEEMGKFVEMLADNYLKELGKQNP